MLQYFVPAYPEQLKVYFIVETILILLNMLLFAWMIVVALRVQFHINLKIIIVSTMGQYYISLSSRLGILCLESSIFTKSALPESHWLVLFLCFLRSYHMCLVLSMPMWLYCERKLAMYYIHDYEKNPRRWISLALITVSTFYSSYGSASFTLNWCPWQVLILFGALIGVIGCLLFYQLKARTEKLYDELNQDHRTSKLPYSLSIRFQLIENMKSTKLICNAIVGLALINVAGFLLFSLAHLEIVASWFGLPIVQLLDVVFNLYVTLNGPIIVIAMIIRNSYMIKLMKSTIMGEVMPMETQTDEGQIYFMQLKEQWGRPTTPSIAK